MSHGAPMFPSLATRLPPRITEPSSDETGTSRRLALVLWTGFTVIWVALGVLLIASPETVSDLWTRIGELPLWAEVLVWLAFLPVVIAIAAWETSWAVWIRVVIIAACVIWTTYGFWPRRASS